MIETMHNLPIKLDIDESFYEEEERCGYIVSPYMKRVWAVELDLLNHFDSVCKRNNIKYMACGGTILGAVRHQGFIPWDDDIDLMMERESYRKLCEIADTEFSYPYFFQTEYSDPGSIRGHAQLRNSATAGILKNEFNNHYSFNQGIFIDVFILDNIPDNSEKKERFLKSIQKKRKLSLTISRFSYRHNEWTRKNSRFPVRQVKDICSPLFKKVKLEQRMFLKYEYYVSKYNHLITQEKGLISTPLLGERFHYFSDDVRETINAKFEFLTIPIPSNYESVLKKQYGNWSEFVVGNSVHGGVIFDTYVSYKDLLGID